MRTSRLALPARRCSDVARPPFASSLSHTAAGQQTTIPSTGHSKAHIIRTYCSDDETLNHVCHFPLLVKRPVCSTPSLTVPTTQNLFLSVGLVRGPELTSIVTLVPNDHQPVDRTHDAKASGDGNLLIEAGLSATEAVPRVALENFRAAAVLAGATDSTRGREAESAAKSGEHHFSCLAPFYSALIPLL